MKQLTTTLNGKEILLVEVPEKSMSHQLLGDMKVNEFRCLTMPKPGVFKIHRFDLKPAEYTLLGLCSEIKEEVAYSLVERDTLNAGTRPACKNYENGMFVFSDPRSSLRSFVKFHHFNPETTVILIKE